MKTLKSIYAFLCKPVFSYLIFWGWNFIFSMLLLSSLGILGYVIENVVIGFTPLSFSICILFFLLIPIFSILIGVTWLKNDPRKLLKFFYGIELPLWMLFLLKFTLFRELTAGTTHIFIVLFLGLIGYAVELFSLEDKLPDWYKYVHKLFTSFLLFIGLYVFLVGMFYSFPIIVNFMYELFSFGWVSSLNNFGSFFFIGFLLIIFTLITVPLVVLLPIFIIIIYIKSFINNFKNVQIRKFKYLSVAFFVLNFFVFIFLNSNQSQEKAFEIASKEMSVLENRIALQQHEKLIKKGLLNSYLNKYRYISSTDNNHIERLYRDTFEFKVIGTSAQSAYNFLMSPFLYKGDRDADIKKAEELYESNFDIGIQKDNRDAIVAVLKTTWDRDGVEAGVLNVNNEKVLITKQEITIEETEGTASVEIHEVYKNQTFDRQEIFYYFSIPPNTVINGLWLSDDDLESKKYAFKVSPRGAAQQVYKEQVRRRVDPSLLEQVGPFQYRLRAFPILPKTRNYRRKGGLIKEGDNFHLWIRFKTILSSDNDWKMPELIEKRNVYWNETTIRTLNGEKINADTWLPEVIQTKKEMKRSQFVEKLNDSLTIKVKEEKLDIKNYLKNKKVSFVIDGSYSMQNHIEGLQKTLSDFSDKEISNESELHIINREAKNSKRFTEASDIQKGDFYGTNSNIEVLHNFKKEHVNQEDYIIYITDDGGYDKTIDSLQSASFKAPLIVLHVNNLKAPIYADAFLETVQNTKGFIAENVKDINTKLRVYKDDTILSYNDGLVYQRVSLEEKGTKAVKDIVAYEYINKAVNNEDKKIDWLDEVHKIAVDNKIVTKFSSMIVLVNDEQKKRLEELEAKEDRFDREKENGKESLTNPSDPFTVNATPEPEEWLLIGLILLYICYSYYGKRFRVKL